MKYAVETCCPQRRVQVFDTEWGAKTVARLTGGKFIGAITPVEFSIPETPLHQKGQTVRGRIDRRRGPHRSAKYSKQSVQPVALTVVE